MKRGFSLIELSIVLVILGLLTGGVLAGKSLIRASELRSVSTEYARYVTATQAFRDKYFSLPGDMANATSFWGIAAGTTGSDSTCWNAVKTGIATCNQAVADNEISQPIESHLYWQHLANAGLIEGSYAGTNAANGSQTGVGSSMANFVPGWNTPVSKLSGAYWAIGNFSGWNALIYKWLPGNPAAHYRNMMFISSMAGDPWNAAVMTVGEAWNLDTKMDDGLPATGKMESFKTASSAMTGPCITAADTTGIYNLSVTGTLCNAVFVNNF